MSSTDATRSPVTPAPGSAPRAGDVVVTGTGMVSPVGSDAAQTFTSVRAGLRRMQERSEIYACLAEVPELDPPTPLVASAIEHLDPRARSEGRPVEWLGMLAGDAFADLDRRARLSEVEPARLAVLLALPAREGLGPEVRDALLYHFHNFAQRDLLPNVQLSFGGSATGLALLEEAAALVRERRFAAVAVGGVDSWLFRPWLSAADADWKLLSDRNVDGFQPGEAASFLLVEGRADAERRGVAPLAVLRGFGAGRFERAKGLPNTGAELAAVLERVLPAAPPLVVCDLNGVAWRAKEWAFAVSRLGRRLGGDHALEHPAIVLGDVGAATGTTLAALAVHHLSTKHAERPGAVVWAASEDGDRRAVLLERA
jgi:3-oxoacyl-[acyl-carrier-protein] synthase-1